MRSGDRTQDLMQQGRALTDCATLAPQRPAMLASRPNPLGIDLYYYANVCFCFRGKTWLLITRVKAKDCRFFFQLTKTTRNTLRLYITSPSYMGANTHKKPHILVSSYISFSIARLFDSQPIFAVALRGKLEPES